MSMHSLSWRIGLALAVLLLPAACADPAEPHATGEAPVALEQTDPLARINQLPASLEDIVQSVRTDLEANGYDVVRGYWTLFGVEDCKDPIRTVGNCYGNNPTAPYILPAVPQWRDEFVDRRLHHVLKPLQRNMSGTYRLDEREALVVLGELPPQGAYFGIQTYVYSRAGVIDESDEIFQRLAPMPDVRDLLFTLTPNPSRVLVFASIGNSINDVIVEQQSGASFGEQRYFVITPDAVMQRAVSDALLRAGVPDRSHVFTEPVYTQPATPEVVRIGLGPDADDLITIVRYALPDDSVAGERWRQELPLAVLRVRDRNGARATEPYAREDYDARIAYPDLAYADELGQLVGAVKAYWGQPDAFSRSFFSALGMVDLVGQHCLRRPMNCLGDTQDNDTYRIGPGVHIDNGEVVAVVGVLASKTGNATYVSLAINRWDVLTGVANLTQVELEGTASSLAQSVGFDTGDFFLYYLARDCTGLAHCTELPETILPRGETMKILQRNYIVPGTARGADAPQLLNPWVIVLDGTNRP